MKQIWNLGKRLGALALALTLAAGLALPAFAAGEAQAPVCDESYYATLDYYGQLMDSSVVKSYRLNGSTAITDYGVYDRVVNLTDSIVPTVSEGAVTFELGEEAPQRFYFEGKTRQPYEDLPWTFSLSYRLNGVPTPAEELAGKSGLIEIGLDVYPNPGASEYNRNNLVLTAATAFNADDILSLEAEGAEVQLVGNLRAVLFMVMPGEERHFTIRVGSEDFTFSGLVLLAVPATLAQLDQIADLREAKEKTEDSYDAINDSLDVILDSLDGMSGSLRATANGLDQLNSARGTVSAGKGGVYDGADLALADLDSLSGALGSMDGYFDTAAQAAADTTAVLNQLNGTAQSLRPDLEKTRQTITAIQKDTKALRELLTDVEGYNKKATAIAASLASELDDLEDETGGLRFSLDRLEGALRNPGKISTVKASELPLDDMKVTIGGREMTVAEVNRQVALATEIATAYAAAAGGDIATADPAAVQGFLMSYYTGKGITDPAELTAKITAAAAALQFVGGNRTELEATQKELDALNSAVGSVNTRIKEANNIISNLTRPTADVVGQLSDLCGELGDTGVTDDLSALAGLCRDLLKTMKAHEGEGAALLTDVDTLGSVAGQVAQTAENALGQLDDLNDILNAYEPQVQTALADAQTLSGSLQSTLRDTRSALSAAEALARQSGSDLDEGTRQTLGGLADSLRKSTYGLDRTDTIRTAKNTITDLIDDEWDTHTGGENNLLLMDAGAKPSSLTSLRNGTPNSVQYIMRTQEIKVREEDSQAAQDGEQRETGSVWSRIKAMFADFWKAITGLFRH